MSAVRFLRVVLIPLALCPWAPMDAHGTKPQSVPRPEPAIGQVFDIDVSELRPLWIELGWTSGSNSPRTGPSSEPWSNPSSI